MSPSPEILSRGLFVTFEGGEGSGKSTQLRLLAAKVPAPVVRTREPGGTDRAEAIRTVLLNGAVAPFGNSAEAIMFAAARADHVDRVIEPALRDGQHVLCDRFVDSSRAYQAKGAVALEALQRIAVAGSWPDLTLIFDLDPAEGLRRVKERDGDLDRFEASGRDELRRRRDAFLDIAAAEPKRCVVIDADASPEDVHAKVLGVIAARAPRLLEDEADG